MSLVWSKSSTGSLQFQFGFFVGGFLVQRAKQRARSVIYSIKGTPPFSAPSSYFPFFCIPPSSPPSQSIKNTIGAHYHRTEPSHTPLRTEGGKGTDRRRTPPLSGALAYGALTPDRSSSYIV